MLLSIIVIFLLVAVDRALKIFMTAWLEDGPIEVVAGFFRFRYLENTGAAFGMLGKATVVLSVVTAVVLVVMLYMLFFTKNISKLYKLSLIMIIAGGAGNLYDRIAYGYVVDFIEPLFINFAVFNFADILITLGCIMFFIAVLLFEKDKATREAQKKEERQNE